MARIQADPVWKGRLEKKHPKASTLPPPYSDSARELDSSTSSDALLMNLFCPPGAAARIAEHLNLDLSLNGRPIFGYPARVPLLNGTDATEVDLRFGDALCEAKLTEKDFTVKSHEVVRRYRDIEDAFALGELSYDGTHFHSYQLVRNVLAAREHGARLLIFVDQRRPDLAEKWGEVAKAIRDQSLRERCRLVYWQQLAEECVGEHRKFLHIKYGL